MHYFSLLLAIVFEIAGTVCMKFSHGGTRLLPIIGITVFYILSIVALTYATKKIDLSIAYSIWCGGAIIGITLIDYMYFQTSLGYLKILFLSLIFIGIVGLYFFEGEK